METQESKAPEVSKDKLHLTHSDWVLWAHLPHDTNWGEDSYKKIYTIQSLEAAITLVHTLPEKLIKNCMLFIMRDGIKPMWEDKQNRGGGCFSYKVNNKQIIQTWTNLVYKLVCENLMSTPKYTTNVNGITISPKRNFCIVKLWFFHRCHT